MQGQAVDRLRPVEDPSQQQGQMLEVVEGEVKTLASYTAGTCQAQKLRASAPSQVPGWRKMFPTAGVRRQALSGFASALASGSRPGPAARWPSRPDSAAQASLE